MNCFGNEAVRHPLVDVVDMSKVANPQRFNYNVMSFGFYMVVYKEHGCGPLTYGLSKYDYDNGTLLFFAPNQKIEVADVGSPQGKILMFSSDLLPRTILETMMRRYTFFSYSVNEALHISQQEKKQFFDTLDNIELELEHSLDKHSREIVVMNLQLLMSYCLRYYDRQFISREVMNVELVDRFKTLLMEYYGTEAFCQKGMPQVRYFADKCNMTPNYFGDLIRKSMGISPSQYIQEYVISIAKQRLLTSQDNISEIAYRLGFEYPQYFTRLFKKLTGLSPQEFRQQS